jgi:adenosylhomocysteine nucleosidase
MGGRILVTLAVGTELAPWHRLRRFRRVRFGSCSFHQTRVGHADVLVILAGVGARHAEVVTALAVQSRPRVAVVAGVAAGLKPELRPGDIVVAESVWNIDESESVRSDPQLFECSLACGAKPIRRLLSLDRIVRTVEGKSRLAHTGDAAEMESLAVMQRLSRQGVPAVAVRAIADGAGQDVPCDFEMTLDHLGQIRFSRLLLQLIRGPSKLAAFARFGLSSRRATICLAYYLDRLVGRLAGQDTFGDPALVTTGR